MPTLPHRPLPHCVLVLGLLSACGADAPTPTPQQARRRAALAPVDVEAKKLALREARRVYDGQMRLLPGDEVVAGVRLPRDLERKLKVENRHYFHTEVPLSKLRAYFGPRLKTAEVVPDGERTFKYVRAETSDSDEPHLVTLRLGPSSADPHVHEVMIEDHTIGRVNAIEPFERSRAQLRALREHAE